MQQQATAIYRGAITKHDSCSACSFRGTEQSVYSYAIDGIFGILYQTLKVQGHEIKVTFISQPQLVSEDNILQTLANKIYA